MSDITTPHLSVCMATYNGERFVGQQIATILTQIGSEDELIVSDDGSTDSTYRIISSIADPRICLISNSNPGSPARNFENALRYARGALIFLADQDDIWEPNKIAVQTALLSYYDLVVSDCLLIDKSGNLLADSFFALQGSGPGFFKNLYKNSFLGCCMAFRRSILKKVLPFPPAIAMHDIWIGLIAELYGSTYFCPEKLVCYRRHDSSASTAGAKSTKTLTSQVSYRLYFLYAIACHMVSGR
ncbi:MAG: glycosyltransferase family 2 protein [Desulfuromonadaceae bacterium]